MKIQRETDDGTPVRVPECLDDTLLILSEHVASLIDIGLVDGADELQHVVNYLRATNG